MAKTSSIEKNNRRRRLSAQYAAKRKKLTVFFSDIEGFSLIAEKMSPDDLMSLMNEYLSAMTDAIEAGDAERTRKLATRHIADTQTYFSAGDPEQRIVALSPQALARRQR